MCRILSGQPAERYEPITRRLRLERSFWKILDRMAAREGMTTPAFVSRLHDEVLDLHGAASNFASLLRCACPTDVTQQGTVPAYAVAAE